MAISLKIYIPKNENFGKTITLDDPIILNSCSEMLVKSISIFWNYDNLNENYYYTYDTQGAKMDIIHLIF